MQAPNTVPRVGISPKQKNPTTADRMNSMYLNGATADTVTCLKAFNMQYSSKFAPQPSKMKKIQSAACTLPQDTHVGIATTISVTMAV
jgi:hypothetical protein